MADASAWNLFGIAPYDNTYRDADDEVHRAFWEFIAERGVARFRWRCSEGLDNRGVVISSYAPIAESTRRRGRWRSHTGQGSAGNPPLSPALGRSRTEDLIRGRGFSDHSEWYWEVDEVTGRHWGQIMLWHAEGAGHLPVRNVIGWSRDDIAWLRAEGASWWYAFQHGQRVAEAAKRLELSTEHLEAFRHTPAKIKLVGRTDIEYATFGIGGNRDRTAKAIEEGYHTGFRRLPPRGTPSPAAPGAPPAAPAPVPWVHPPRVVPGRPRGKTVKKPPAAPKTPPPKPPAAPAPKPNPVPWVHPPRTVPGRPRGKSPRKPPAVAKAPWVNPYDAMPTLNPLAHERAPITRHAAGAAVPTPGPPPDLATFAARARAAADTVGREGRYGEKKVFISHAHAAYVKAHGPIPLPEFKELLGRAVQARHLNMSRADLVEAMDAMDVRSSTMFHPMGMELHFIRTDY